MILATPLLIDANTFDIRRRVLEYAAGQVDDLRITILNEEEIVLRGQSDTSRGRRLAQIGAQMAAPGAKVRNEIDIARLPREVVGQPSNPRR